MAARKVLSGLDLTSQKIVNLADGSSAADAATYGQLLSLLAGLAWKPSVRVASTANNTIASPGATIDGITMVSGDRVLAKNQTTGSENGIYVWNGAAVPMTRATDLDTGAQAKNATVRVEEGTVNADTQWTNTTDSVTIGSTTMMFVNSGAGAAYTATSTGGLQLVGGAFSVLLPASSGLVKDATGLYVDRSLVMTRFSQDVGDGSSTSIAVTHNLGTRDVHVAVYDKTSNAEVIVDIVHTSTTVVTLIFAVAPTSAQYRCVVVG